MTATARICLLVGLCAGCGGKDAKATDPATPTAIKEPTGAGTAQAVGPEIDAFHAALAPLWHAVGPSRMSTTCNAVGDLTTKLAKVMGAGPPGDLDAGAWKSAAHKMATTLEDVEQRCRGTDRTGFESAFTELHLAFHEYMDLVVGEHGHGQGDGRGGKEGIVPAGPAPSGPAPTAP